MRGGMALEEHLFAATRSGSTLKQSVSWLSLSQNSLALYGRIEAISQATSIVHTRANILLSVMISQDNTPEREFITACLSGIKIFRRSL